jgi:hypothetical protein
VVLAAYSLHFKKSGARQTEKVNIKAKLIKIYKEKTVAFKTTLFNGGFHFIFSQIALDF